MKQKMVRFALAWALVGLVPVHAMAQCYFPTVPLLPPNTNFPLGPNMYAAIVAYAPHLTSRLLAARDAWDATDAANRIGDWNGIVTGSDCPSADFQGGRIAAMAFTPGSCFTYDSYGFNPSYCQELWIERD
jgi:hypothetical protein